jgi:hypothetical protein
VENADPNSMSEKPPIIEDNWLRILLFTLHSKVIWTERLYELTGYGYFCNFQKEKKKKKKEKERY